MKLNYKKQKLVESLGFNVNFKNHYGNKPQNVKVTPDQFKRLMESYLIYEEEMHKEEEDLELAEFADSFQDELDQDILDEMDMEKETKEGYGKKHMDEMNFGDDGGLNLPSDVDMDTENDNNPIDLDEYGYQSIDHSDRDEFDGRKSRVVGVYSDINKQRYGMNEDSEGEETYHYDEDLHHDRDELHHLERERSHAHGGHKSDLDQHIAALIDSMKYDDKRGVGKDDMYRREPGTHFYHEGNGLAESVDKTFKMIRESIRRERPKGLRMSNYSRKTLNEQFVGYTEMGEQFYGGRGNYNNPGVNAAKGIEELVKNIKKAYNFIKDSRTRKQIENTLVKLQNFMAITADAVMAGKQQRAPRRNDQLTRPLPYPELDEPEDLEDIDDELDLDSLNESQRHNLLREAKRELRRRTLREGAGGGCKCPDGTMKPECCNTEAQKKGRAIGEKLKAAKKALTKQFFAKKPKGTMTIGEYGTLEMVNGSKDGIVSPSGVPDFKDLWSAGGNLGRGFESGNGKFTYVYTTEKGMEGKEQLLVSNAPDNKGGSCDEGCYYYSRK